MSDQCCEPRCCVRMTDAMVLSSCFASVLMWPLIVVALPWIREANWRVGVFLGAVPILCGFLFAGCLYNSCRARRPRHSKYADDVVIFDHIAIPIAPAQDEYDDVSFHDLLKGRWMWIPTIFVSISVIGCGLMALDVYVPWWHSLTS